VNPAYDEHTVFGLFYLALRGGREVIAGRRNLARLQRASKGSRESTRGRGNHVIEGRRAWLVGVGRDFVVLGDRSVHAENNGLFLSRKIGPSDRTFHALDPHFRSIDDVRHVDLLASGT